MEGPRITDYGWDARLDLYQSAFLRKQTNQHLNEKLWYLIPALFCDAALAQGPAGQVKLDVTNPYTTSEP